MKSGTTDKVEGSAKVASGKVKEETGKVFRKPSLEDKGVAEQVEGHVQKKVGEIKKVFNR
ncbi:MAG TPA: CsbD family protein [Opitutaceae bacterium]|jgi:uncharacterized protein YjbJ (UPF0337 family)